ncbi:hypothetical protein SAMN05443573_11128 [Celeribacter indicus]|nr:hypothetical protein SAMN05443573_11128 [Celeribacter indicus]
MRWGWKMTASAGPWSAFQMTKRNALYIIQIFIAS